MHEGRTQPQTLGADVAVIGAGPAGLAAAARAAEAGATVVIVDDNPGAGGQIWRRAREGPIAAWMERLNRPNVRWAMGTTVTQVLRPGLMLAQTEQGAVRIKAERVVLATGARELFIPFPGWTLPNAMGVGGLQAMVKTGWDVAGKRVLVAGAGPLLLAVAAYLVEKNARVVGVAEQSPASAVFGFAASLWRYPGKLGQALALKGKLLGVPQWLGTWPVRAEGHGRVERVTLTDGRREWTVACEALACSFGLVPNTSMAAGFGCAVRDGSVVVDRHQATTVPGVWCAGESTGIGGVDVSLVEGEIAGLSAADRFDEAQGLFEQRLRAHAFAAKMTRAFAVRDEVRSLADDGTILCRCEDVRMGRVRTLSGWREAKLVTRCGMGPCQGRVCGAAAREVLGWEVADARPPVSPVPMGLLAECSEADEVGVFGEEKHA